MVLQILHGATYPDRGCTTDKEMENDKETRGASHKELQDGGLYLSTSTETGTAALGI